jgi:hypothetical protein
MDRWAGFRMRPKSAAVRVDKRVARSRSGLGLGSRPPQEHVDGRPGLNHWHHREGWVRMQAEHPPSTREIAMAADILAEAAGVSAGSWYANPARQSDTS